jgi:hypothetical protein
MSHVGPLNVGPLNVGPFGPYKNPNERIHGPLIEGALKDRVIDLPAQQVKLPAPTKGGRRRKIRKSRKNHKSRRNYKSRKNYRKYIH